MVSWFATTTTTRARQLFSSLFWFGLGKNKDKFTALEAKKLIHLTNLTIHSTTSLKQDLKPQSVSVSVKEDLKLPFCSYFMKSTQLSDKIVSADDW